MRGIANIYSKIAYDYTVCQALVKKTFKGISLSHNFVMERY